MEVRQMQAILEKQHMGELVRSVAIPREVAVSGLETN
jgi:hypothetical protein